MSDEAKEIVLTGVGVSPGVVSGPVFLLNTEDVRFAERSIAPDEIPREIARFEDALIATRRQIRDIQKKVETVLDQKSAGIFEAHLLVVDDRSFVEEVLRGLSNYHLNAESVLQKVTATYVEALSRVDDDYLRERVADIKDVARRILRNLSGQAPSTLARFSEPCVVVANDIAPSDTAQMNREHVIGFATDLGSPSSHTAIMARALDIPAVVALRDASIRVKTGDRVLVDGGKGLLILNPTRDRLEHYGHVARAQETIRHQLETLRSEPSETLDGYAVTLSANIEQPHDVESVLSHGAEGVGLYRTEFLYLSRTELPDELEQARAYEEVASRLAPAPVIIRTLDIGGDKFSSAIRMPKEMNPFMGWRAIRFCLAQPEIFLAQLRAILRASRHRNVKIMYPMISNVDEVIHANRLLDRAKLELKREKVEFDEDLDVGIMVEVPSAALSPHLFTPHVKFFSIGTNDLIQYTLAADRVNENITYLYEPTHPSILRLVRHTIEASHDAGLWTGVCGEMAGNPLLVPLLVGLGADEFSVSPNLVPMVKDVIRKIRYHQAEDLARASIASGSAAAVLQLCRDLTGSVAPEILELLD